MQIELAVKQDIPALLDLQRKAFGSRCKLLDWEDALPMTETEDHALEEFAQNTTLVVKNEDGQIIASIRGSMEKDSLYMNRLMVLPEYQRQGIGKLLFREIQRLLPHERAWLCVLQQERFAHDFYMREGFKPFMTEDARHGLTWVYMEKKNMTSYCGLDCAKCDAYIATKNNDQALREKTAKLWSELNHVHILPEHINCGGCRADGVKTVFCESMCQIRQCALKKGVENCGCCSELAGCKMAAAFHANNPEARKNLEKNI